jgi:hypothetical protein
MGKFIQDKKKSNKIYKEPRENLFGCHSNHLYLIETYLAAIATTSI